MDDLIFNDSFCFNFNLKDDNRKCDRCFFRISLNTEGKYSLVFFRRDKNATTSETIDSEFDGRKDILVKALNSKDTLREVHEYIEHVLIKYNAPRDQVDQFLKELRATVRQRMEEYRVRSHSNLPEFWWLLPQAKVM